MYSPNVQKTETNKQTEEIIPTSRYVALLSPNSQIASPKLYLSWCAAISNHWLDIAAISWSLIYSNGNAWSYLLVRFSGISSSFGLVMLILARIRTLSRPNPLHMSPKGIKKLRLVYLQVLCCYLINNRALSIWLSEEIWFCFGFVFLCWAIGIKHPRHLLIWSEV